MIVGLVEQPASQRGVGAAPASHPASTPRAPSRATRQRAGPSRLVPILDVAKLCRWRAARCGVGKPSDRSGRHRASSRRASSIHCRCSWTNALTSAARVPRGTTSSSVCGGTRRKRQIARPPALAHAERSTRELCGPQLAARFEKSELLRHRRVSNTSAAQNATAPRGVTALDRRCARSAARRASSTRRAILRREQQRPLDEIARRANLAALERVRGERRQRLGVAPIGVVDRRRPGVERLDDGGELRGDGFAPRRHPCRRSARAPTLRRARSAGCRRRARARARAPARGGDRRRAISAQAATSTHASAANASRRPAGDVALRAVAQTRRGSLGRCRRAARGAAPRSRGNRAPPASRRAGRAPSAPSRSCARHRGSSRSERARRDRAAPPRRPRARARTHTRRAPTRRATILSNPWPRV